MLKYKMYRAQYVLTILVVFVEFSHSWDFAVSRGPRIEFYTNDMKTDFVSFSSYKPAALAYDEVHNMMFFVDKGQLGNDAICVHDRSSKDNTCLIERNGRNIHGIAFDQTTSLIYFTDVNERSINYISLKARGDIYGNLLIKKDHGIPTDIVVESCRGFIYWINRGLTTPTIERAFIDGSDVQVIVNSKTLFISPTYKIEPHSLTIDQRTQRLYWMEPLSEFYYCIYHADLNGNGKTCLNYLGSPNEIFYYPVGNTLAVSKSILYFGDWGDEKALVFKFDKTEGTALNYFELQPKNVNNGIVANYNIQERIQCIKDCVPLTYIHVYERKTSCEGPYCVHGPKILGQALCKCPPGYKGDRCDVSVCDKYCLRGTCTVNDEGLPVCSCRAGYAGKRCGIDVCHGHCQNDGVCSVNEKNEPVCECKGEHTGDRCEVSNCLNYCIKGSCSLKDDGLPQCRCDAGYSGERCDINVCHGYCQNNGDCTLNDKSEPVCECKGEHTGDRCEVSSCLNYCIKGSCSVKDDGLPQCRCDAGYSGHRCEVNDCHRYCLNDGICYLNEEDEASCECVAGFEGSRCEISQSCQAKV